MTVVDDLIAFLRARLDEDEQAARAATPGPWQAEPAVDSAYSLPSALVFRTDVDRNAPWSNEWVSPWVVQPDSEGSEGIEPADAEHIARWDPARVLAEVEAKRRMLELHVPEPSGYINGVYQMASEPIGDPFCSHCANLCHSSSGIMCDNPDAPWPCPTVRILALPYADHPDYREQWRPT